jgi:hypothetical protein
MLRITCCPFQKKTRRGPAGLFNVGYLNLHPASGMKQRYSPGTKFSSGVKITWSRMKPSSRTHKLSVWTPGLPTTKVATCPAFTNSLRQVYAPGGKPEMTPPASGCPPSPT